MECFLGPQWEAWVKFQVNKKGFILQPNQSPNDWGSFFKPLQSYHDGHWEREHPPQVIMNQTAWPITFKTESRLLYKIWLKVIFRKLPFLLIDPCCVVSCTHGGTIFSEVSLGAAWGWPGVGWRLKRGRPRWVPCLPPALVPPDEEVNFISNLQST